MIRVRVAEDGDADAIRRVIHSAFAGAEVARLADRLRASEAYLPGLTFVADDGGDVVGMVMLIRATVRHDDSTTTDVLNLSPLAVQPSRQREGIGRRLVEVAVQAAAERAETLVLLEGDPALYRRLGFEPAARYGIEAPSPAVPEHAFQVYTLPDTKWHGAGRANYPSPFWAAGVGLPETVDESGPFAVPWLFEFSRYAGWLETVAAGNHGYLVPACPGLTVGEVLRHLGVVYRVIGRWIDEGRRPGDVPAEPADGDLDSWFAGGWRDLFQRLAARPPGASAATWLPYDNTLGFWRRRMTHETAIHALDVLSSVPDHADDWNADDGLATDGIDEALRLWLGVRAGRDVGGSGQVVRIETLSRMWTVALHTDLVEVHELKTSTDARVSGAPDSMYAWLWGRSAEVEIDGDQAATDLLRSVLSRAMQ